MPASHLQPYVWMLCGCFWFSWMGILAHALKDSVSWQLVAVARSSLAFFFAFIVAWYIGARFVWFRPPVLWLRSISGSCSMVTTFFALGRLPVSDVLTITNTFPLWIALLAWPMGHERPTFSVWIAVVCSIAGVAVTQHCEIGQLELAHAAALAASIFTAFAMLGINRLQALPSISVVVHFSGVSTLFCIAAFFIFDRSVSTHTIDETNILIRLIGVGATATVGQIFLTKAFKSGSATKVAVVSLSQVVMVMVYEGIFEGRRFDAWQIVGTAMVLGPSGYLMAKERKQSSVRSEGVHIE